MSFRLQEEHASPGSSNPSRPSQPGDGAMTDSGGTPGWLRALVLAGLLYVFLCSIELMGTSFKLMGKGFAETLLTTTSNPFAGLLVGILATSLVQSSSTVTSLIVGLVAGGVLTVSNAVPMIMGANIGTSITNTIVAMGHMTRDQEFQRAFAGATIHDFFNLMAVTVLLPLEVLFHPLQRSAEFVSALLFGADGLEFKSPLKAVVKPTVKAIQHGVEDVVANPTAVAIILVVLALAFLFFSLAGIVRLMRRLMMGRAELVLHKFVFQSPARGLLAGALLTVLVQSSSVTTSLAVPLVAAGLVSVHSVFPFILGANVGTTVTALLASLVTGSAASLTVALCHFFFNLYGILLLYPFRRIPILAAQSLGAVAVRSKVYAIGYVLAVFFGVPLVLIAAFR